MKILHVVSSLNRNAGGISEVVPRLCEELKHSGQDVRIVTCKSKEYSDAALSAENAGVPIVHAELNQCRFGLAFSWDFKKRIEESVADADIVHINGLWQAPGWIAARAAQRGNKPFVIQPHGLLEPARLKISKWKKCIAGVLVEKRNLKRATALVATSKSEAEGFGKYGIDVTPYIMPIGLDWQKFVSDENTKSKRLGKKKLLYFSRVSPIKGLDMLAYAWARLKRLHSKWDLVVAGPDDRGYASRIKSVFESLSPDGSVHFIGPVYGDDKLELLHSADAFVLPTRSENWSIAVAEAMASGVPVVCTKGAPWQCLNECGAGKWVDVSINGITEGLEAVMSASDMERMDMGRKGREWVKENLDWGKIAESAIKFYHSCVEDS